MANVLGSHKGGRLRKYGRQFRDRMRELLKQGLRPYAVAKKLGCHRMTVYRESEIGTQP
jgi:hypothetical protein